MPSTSLGAKLTAAEDAVQTTLVSCYRSWRKVGRADNTDAYVYKPLANSSRRRRHGEPPTADVTENAGHRGDYAGTVETAITRTKPSRRPLPTSKQPWYSAPTPTCQSRRQPSTRHRRQHRQEPDLTRAHRTKSSTVLNGLENHNA